MTLLSQSMELLRRARALLHELESEGLEAASGAGLAAQLSGASRPLLAAPVLRLAWSAAAEAVAWNSIQGYDNAIRGGPAAFAVTSPRGVRAAANEAPAASVPGPLSSGAEAFLAGQGARVYSLDVWRRTHPRGRTPHAA
jgi:hypothetical protein